MTGREREYFYACADGGRMTLGLGLYIISIAGYGKQHYTPIKQSYRTNASNPDSERFGQ